MHSNLCVSRIAADALFRGYKTVIAKDGVEAFTQEDQDQGLKYLENIYKAKTKTVEEIIAEFSRK